MGTRSSGHVRCHTRMYAVYIGVNVWQWMYDGYSVMIFINCLHENVLRVMNFILGNIKFIIPLIQFWDIGISLIVHTQPRGCYRVHLEKSIITRETRKPLFIYLLTYFVTHPCWSLMVANLKSGLLWKGRFYSILFFKKLLIKNGSACRCMRRNMDLDHIICTFCL